MSTKTSAITFRVTDEQRKLINMISAIENKSMTSTIIGLVNKELKNRRLSAKELRSLPKEIRLEYLKKMSVEAVNVYNMHKEVLDVEDIMDGIE